MDLIRAPEEIRISSYAETCLWSALRAAGPLAVPVALRLYLYIALRSMLSAVALTF
jgi:hypothetical protein